MFVSEKLTLVGGVLEMLVKDCNRGAAIETVLHLPVGVNSGSSGGDAGITSDAISLCHKSIMEQFSSVRQNILCDYS